MRTQVETAPATSRFPYPLVSALGVGQIVAWGSFYYVFVSLTDPMAAEFGWTKTQISGALSVVLAVTGLCSYARGRWVDRYGGRRMMTLPRSQAQRCSSDGLTSPSCGSSTRSASGSASSRR